MNIKVATKEDACDIKNLINEMYKSEYEKRQICEIELAIRNKDEIYTLAYDGDNIIGFAGATTDSKEYLNVTNEVTTVIEYIYVKENYRGLIVAFNLLKTLISELLNNQISSALMQVQTYNKQRFLHYALCDKNIIKSMQCEWEPEYEDQILLIKDLGSIVNITLKDFIRKVEKYSK